MTECPECHHDIDRHEFDEPCWECFYVWDGSDGPNETHFCKLRPSDIARALLAAEPTEAMLDAAADAINAVDIGQMSHRDIRLAFARAALKAAREARA